MTTSRRGGVLFSVATLNYVLGFVPIYFAPVLITILAEGGATPTLAAKVGSGAMILSTIATLATPLVFRHSSSASVVAPAALLGLLMASLLGLGVAKGPWSILAVLTLSAASGVLIASAVKQESQHKNADTRLGYLTAMGTAMIALLLAGLGTLGIKDSSSLVFATWALLLLVALLTSPLLNRQCVGQDLREEAAHADLDIRLTSPTNLVFLLGIAMVFALSGGVYTFASVYLDRLGFDADFLLTVLSICVSAQVIGAMATGLALRIMSPRTATAIGVAGICIGTTTALFVTNKFGFASAFALYGAGFFCAMVSVLVWARDIDSSGTLPPVVQGIMNLMFAGGTMPFLALMEARGLGYTTIVQVLFSVLGVILLVTVAGLSGNAASKVHRRSSKTQ